MDFCYFCRNNCVKPACSVLDKCSAYIPDSRKQKEDNGLAEVIDYYISLSIGANEITEELMIREKEV